jgi:hypothetical protein
LPLHHRGRTFIPELDMPVARLLTAMLISLGVTACGSDSEAPSEPPPVEDTVAGDLVGAMDKARAVEDTTMQHKEDLDRAVDAAENPR